MKVKNAFHWTRSCSCVPGGIDISAGAPVELHKGTYYVSPSHFSDSIVRHDAIHYGCIVMPDNVEE